MTGAGREARIRYDFVMPSSLGKRPPVLQGPGCVIFGKIAGSSTGYEKITMSPKTV